MRIEPLEHNTDYLQINYDSDKNTAKDGERLNPAKINQKKRCFGIFAFTTLFAFSCWRFHERYNNWNLPLVGTVDEDGTLNINYKYTSDWRNFWGIDGFGYLGKVYAAGLTIKHINGSSIAAPKHNLWCQSSHDDINGEFHAELQWLYQMPQSFKLDLPRLPASISHPCDAIKEITLNKCFNGENKPYIKINVPLTCEEPKQPAAPKQLHRKSQLFQEPTQVTTDNNATHTDHSNSTKEAIPPQ